MYLEKLKRPASLFRQSPFWIWNDKLDEQELRRQIQEMADKGWGSYFVHSRVGLVTGYLSDEWMSLMRACADEAQKTGTHLWLYDEDKWPSGFAGGTVPEMLEGFRCMALVLVPVETAGADPILSEVSHNGVDYRICMRISKLGDTWFNGACYVDLMNCDVVKAFIGCTHEMYKAICGEYFGSVIPGIFTDEPCYIFQNNYSDPAVPWTNCLPQEFLSAKGYDIKDKLPELFFDIGSYRKTRFDFYDVVSDLFKTSFTKHYSGWCSDNNLIMTGHFMGDDNLCEQTRWSGDVMSHYELMQWPGIDKLYRNLVGIVSAKQVSSVADQLKKERTLSEMYGCVGNQASFFHRKWIGDWQAVLGINFITSHLSLYSMRGERKRDCPADFFYQQPWWDDERGFADYQARLCAAVTEGKRQVDVLIIQPLSSVWSEYTPLNTDLYGPWPKKLASYDIPFEQLSTGLMSEKIDFHYGNEKLMAKYGSVKDGRLAVGDHSYGCVVVPPSCVLRSTTVTLLKHYVGSGGKLIFIRPGPSLVDGVEADLRFPSARIVFSVEEAISLVSQMYPDRVIATDKLTGENAPTVYIQSRVVGNSVRHLLVNTSENREIQAKIAIPACDALAVFDLFSGTLYKVTSPQDGLDAILAPAGSLLVISGDEAKGAEDVLPPAIGSGVEFTELRQYVPTHCLDDLECEALEDNVFLLNDFILEMDGREVHRGPVCGAWHKHFYPAADGTPFRAKYIFESECDIEGCFAAIEVAENLDRITFNGQSLSPLKSRGELGPFDPAMNWKDVAYTKVPLPGILRGINELVLEGVKINNVTGMGFHHRVPDWQNHLPTEAEEVYICGRFNVRKVTESRYVISQFHKPSGKNITNEGFPFYCGRVRFAASFDLSDKGNRVILQLNGANMASGRVLVNGRYCGTLRWKPLQLDITEAAVYGHNEVTVEMAVTLVNAFGPNRRPGIKDVLGIGPYDYANPQLFHSSYELFDYGLESISIFCLTPQDIPVRQGA